VKISEIMSRDPACCVLSDTAQTVAKTRRDDYCRDMCCSVHR